MYNYSAISNISATAALVSMATWSLGGNESFFYNYMTFSNPSLYCLFLIFVLFAMLDPCSGLMASIWGYSSIFSCMSTAESANASVGEFITSKASYSTYASTASSSSGCLQPLLYRFTVIPYFFNSQGGLSPKYVPKR